MTVLLAILAFLTAFIRRHTYTGAHIMATKTRLPDPDADTASDILTAEIIPAQKADYPAWLDGFQQQIASLLELARQGNPVAYSLAYRLHDQFQETSTAAAQLATIHTIFQDGA